MDQVDGRTCSIDTYRIYELSKEPCDAVPPFIYSETFRSNMERKELYQESYYGQRWTSVSKRHRWHKTYDMSMRQMLGCKPDYTGR